MTDFIFVITRAEPSNLQKNIFYYFGLLRFLTKARNDDGK